VEKRRLEVQQMKFIRKLVELLSKIDAGNYIEKGILVKPQ
jgi:hypothetical protein